jgi:glyoxylase-like metal-dependent hydrolase (beta-lactamase superfamily II)
MSLPTVRAADPARLEQTALEVVLRAAEDGERAVPGHVSNPSPQEAAARLRAARPHNPLPEGVSIRELMVHGRA